MHFFSRDIALSALGGGRWWTKIIGFTEIGGIFFFFYSRGDFQGHCVRELAILRRIKNL